MITLAERTALRRWATAQLDALRAGQLPEEPDQGQLLWALGYRAAISALLGYLRELEDQWESE